MKKAYVKSVFLAEEFEGTANVAACDYHASRNPARVWKDLTFCHDNGHKVGKNNSGINNGWWEYATETENAVNGPMNGETVGEIGSTYKDAANLFTSGSYVCDFIWDSKDSDIFVWTKDEGDLDTAISDHTGRQGAFATLVSSFVSFFYGIGDGACKMHEPEYLNEKIFS